MVDDQGVSLDGYALIVTLPVTVKPSLIADTHCTTCRYKVTITVAERPKR